MPAHEDKSEEGKKWAATVCHKVDSQDDPTAACGAKWSSATIHWNHVDCEACKRIHFEELKSER